MPGRKGYTLIIAKDEYSRVRTINIPHFVLYFSAIICAAVFCAAAGGAAHYWKLSARLADYSSLAQENKEIRLENQNYRALSQHIREKLSLLEMISKKLTITAGIESASAHGGKTAEALPQSVAPAANALAQSHNEFKQFEEEMSKVEVRLRRVNQVYNEQSFLSAYTPSIWPVVGVPSRGFGAHVDPWTGEGERHRGIDIPAPYGRRVEAAAAGVVIFAGYRADYGNLVIIEHKLGLSTWYGHLARIKAHAGQHVRRHDMVGQVGSTGRSTGPHLHYEVRINNAPVNPNRFLSRDRANKESRSIRKGIDAD